MLEQANEYRAAMIEAAAEQDEECMMKYLEGEELTVEEIKTCIRKGTWPTPWSPFAAALLTATRAFRNCWMPLSTTCLLPPTFPPSGA